MPSELVYRLAGGKQNTDPAKSLGGETSAWPVDLVDLFPPVSEHDTAHGQVLYRALDVLNVGDQGARRLKAYCVPAKSIELGWSVVADVGAIGGDAAKPPWDHGQFVTLARYTKTAPLPLPDIQCGRALRLWLKRTIPQGSKAGADSETLHLTYL